MEFLYGKDEARGKIVVFDSGVGGLNILNALREKYPNESYIYIADEKYMPYGTRTLNFLKKRVGQILYHFKAARAIIIACNTASAVYLSSALNMPNVFEIIGVTSEYAQRLSRNKNIGIIATDMTVSLGKYQEHLRAMGANAYALKYSELVNIIEAKAKYTEQAYKALLDISLSQRLKYFADKNIDTLICGCTHFGYLREDYKRHLGNINYVVSDGVVVSYVEGHIAQGHAGKPACVVYTTGEPREFNEKMRSLGYTDRAEHLEL